MVSTKLLGVIISEDLKWKEHTNVVSNKVSKSIGVLNKIRYILSVGVLSTLFCTLILPYINIATSHGLVITLKTYINYICCKNELPGNRITSQVKWRDHTSILFKRNRKLNIFYINKFQIVCFMYKFNNNLLPVNFNMFSKLMNKYITMTLVIRVIFISFLIIQLCVHLL